MWQWGHLDRESPVDEQSFYISLHSVYSFRYSAEIERKSSIAPTQRLHSSFSGAPAWLQDAQRSSTACCDQESLVRSAELSSGSVWFSILLTAFELRWRCVIDDAATLLNETRVQRTILRDALDDPCQLCLKGIWGLKQKRVLGPDGNNILRTTHQSPSPSCSTSGLSGKKLEPLVTSGWKCHLTGQIW